MLCVNTRLLSFFLELSRFSVRVRPLFPDVKNEKIQTETINQIDFIPPIIFYRSLLFTLALIRYFPRFSGNVDIVNGNLKLILGLIWSLIVRYQIGKSKFPPRKLMLAWLKVSMCARYNCCRRGRGIAAINQIQRYYYFTRTQSGTRAYVHVHTYMY